MCCVAGQNDLLSPPALGQERSSGSFCGREEQISEHILRCDDSHLRGRASHDHRCGALPQWSKRTRRWKHERDAASTDVVSPCARIQDGLTFASTASRAVRRRPVNAGRTRSRDMRPRSKSGSISNKSSV